MSAGLTEPEFNHFFGVTHTVTHTSPCGTYFTNVCNTMVLKKVEFWRSWLVA